MSTMVNLRIGFQEPLTRPGVKLDEKMSICSSTPQHEGCTNSSFLEGDVKVRKCHAMLFLRTCMSGKEIEIAKHMFCVFLCRRGRV